MTTPSHIITAYATARDESSSRDDKDIAIRLIISHLLSTGTESNHREARVAAIESI